MTTTQPPHSTDQELKKLKLETEKLRLDIQAAKEKPRIDKRNFWIDVVAKVAIPVSLLVIAWATYISNTDRESQRMVFDIENKRIEHKHKEQELTYKKTDSERQKDALQSAFINNNLALIVSSSPDAESQVASLAKHMLPKEDVEEILKKISLIRANHIKPTNSSTSRGTLNSSDYKEVGFKYLKAGNYELALVNYETATLLNPSDPDAWNSKAYSEMKTDRNEAAWKSISVAINLQPIDTKLQNNVMINAAKILCSLGRTEEGTSYIRQGISYSPSLLATVRGDSEFKRRCGISI